jgi:chromosome partitioning protein
MKVVVFSNQKGGVGKTTTTREVGIYLASRGYKVLFIDCDPQGNLTKSLLEEEEAENGLYAALGGHQFTINELTPNCDILVSCYALSLLEKSLIGEVDAHTRLKTLFTDPVFAGYDYLFLDTPPSLGVLTLNALAAADYLVVPMNPALYSMQGTNDLFNTVSKVRSNLNPHLTLLGVIINEYDALPIIIRQIRCEIAEAFGERLFKTMLSHSIKIEESIASKAGVIYHKKLDKSPIKAEVTALGDEFLVRLNASLVSLS